MTDGPDSRSVRLYGSVDQSVEELANTALKVLAQQRGTKPKVLSEDHLLSLSQGVLDRDSLERDRAIAAMRAAGISIEEIIDHYIPEVARRLGARWCEDSLGFADVTIGSARLQSLLRELSLELNYPTGDQRQNGVAVVVLADNYHTLGAMVLTTQLRRLGVSVRLLLGVSHHKALSELQDERYDAVLISISETEALDKLGKLVEKIRRQTQRNTPIVVGGPILGHTDDVKAKTGADVATSDIYEAIRACQLKTFRAEPSKAREER